MHPGTASEMIHPVFANDNPTVDLTESERCQTRDLTLFIGDSRFQTPALQSSIREALRPSTPRNSIGLMSPKTEPAMRKGSARGVVTRRQTLDAPRVSTKHRLAPR